MPKLTAKKATNTRLSWNQTIGKVIEFTGTEITFGHIDRRVFERFRNFLLEELSQNTARLHLAKLGAALNEAVQDGLLTENPGSGVTIAQEESLPVFLTVEEVRKLDQTCCSNQNVANAFLFATSTGIRSSDIRSLTWDQINDGYLTSRQKKTGRHERLPLSDSAKAILKRQKGASPSAKTGQKFQPGQVFFPPGVQGVHLAVKKWAEDAEIEKEISFHTSRHTFAALSLTSGVDLYTANPGIRTHAPPYGWYARC